MHFNFTDEHLAFREMASEFARNKLAPMADFWMNKVTFQSKL